MERETQRGSERETGRMNTGAGFGMERGERRGHHGMGAHEAAAGAGGVTSGAETHEPMGGKSEVGSGMEMREAADTVWGKELAAAAEKPLATFQVITDTHIRDDADHINNRHFEEALADIASFCAGSLGVMHAGDVTDRGLAPEYREFARIWSSRPAELPPMYVTLGNHDIGAILWGEGDKPIDLSVLSGDEIEDVLDGNFPAGTVGQPGEAAAAEAGGMDGEEASGVGEASGASAKDAWAEAIAESEASLGAKQASAEVADAAAGPSAAQPVNAKDALAEAAAAAGLDLGGMAARLNSLDGDEAEGGLVREMWNRRMRRFAEGTGAAAPYHAHWIGGYHFIFLGSEVPHPKDCDLSSAQLRWLQERLTEKSSPDRPVFVFLHQPLMDTVAGSMERQGWYGVNQDAELKKVLSACPQAILFTGHTHWQLEAERTMYDGQGVMPSMFNASSVAYLWTDGDEHLTGSEGLQVDVYGDRVVVRGRDFVKRAWIEGAEYTVPYPAAGAISTRR
ncbi:metallophosphoesterase family protein [Saccharibacillus brassicae]|uniref:Metallophosphoesterase n=1 Tax=Saccharibacillus brassicae TaxID=2583377 RepID=A0A4Y6URL3_SACBS|nr:metallophosphoesterase [Saccharibacillus brassicae]